MDNLAEETTETSTTAEPSEKSPSTETVQAAENPREEDIIVLPTPDADLLFLEPVYMEDDFDGAESGLVFRPLFVYRNQQVRRRRFGRSLDDQPESRSMRSADLDDMDTAESSIVFRPLFRYRYLQRRRAERRRS